MAKASRRDRDARDRVDEVGEADLEAPRPRRPRAWAGGRWWVGVGRVVLWTFILVVIFNGIWIPLRGGFALPTATSEPEEPAETSGYPETASAAFALRFADTYLNVEDGEARMGELAAFVPEDEVSGFTLPSESLSGENLTVVAVDVQDEHNAVVVVRADVNGEGMRLDVPVYAEEDDSLVVSGRPAMLAEPTQAALPEDSSFDTDEQAESQLWEVLPGFFEAYAEEPGHLNRYLEEDDTLAPLPEDSLQFGELSDITVPSESSSGDDDVRQIVAAVQWEVPAPDGTEPGQLDQDYLVTVVSSGAEWHVRDIQGASHSFGE